MGTQEYRGIGVVKITFFIEDTSQIEDPVFRIFVWQFAVHNICKPPYCHMVSALNSLYNAMNIF
jgi:hypothetical protein